MGDSLTAGAGVFANSIFHILVENRGVTATGGGQGTWREYLTLPNIIKVIIGIIVEIIAYIHRLIYFINVTSQFFLSV